jgi:hypothetical protein
MRKKNLRAFLKVRGKGAPSLAAVDKQLTITFSAEMSGLIKAEMEKTGSTAEEVAERAVRLQCGTAS